MIRIVVHAGFHKTGTTSVQKALQANRVLLQSEVTLGLNQDIPDLAETARAYSVVQDGLELALFEAMAAAYFGGLGLSAGQRHLISSEDLAGNMPGRWGLRGYSAAPTLMAAIARAARQALGPELELIFHFSTRAPRAWLRSLYWHLISRTEYQSDFNSMCADIAGAENLGGVVDRVAEAVPQHRVQRLLIEDAADDPAAPLFDLLELSGDLRARLTRFTPQNAQPEADLTEAFLALNRTGLARQELRARKTALWAESETET